MNVMQATFLVLQSTPTLDEDILSKAHHVFNFLYSQDILVTTVCCIMPETISITILYVCQESVQSPSDTFQVKPRLGLSEVMEAILSSGFTARGDTPIRLIIEGLLTHFFSPDRPSYTKEDARWFVQLANQQKQWCYNGTEENSAEQLLAKTSVSW